MRRIYIVVGVILLLLSFAGGYYLGRGTVVDHAQELADLQRQKDSVDNLFHMSEARSALLVEEAAKHKLAAQEADIRANNIEQVAQAQAVVDGRRIKRLRALTSHQIDSTLKVLYPDSVRGPYVAFQNKVEVPEWRVRSLVEDRFKLDSVGHELAAKVSIISQLRIGIQQRDFTIGKLEGAVQEKDTAISLLLVRQTQDAKEIKIHVDDVRKYKRQRNVIAASAIAVVAGTIWGSVQILKR